MPAHATPNKKPHIDTEHATYTVTQLEHELRVAFSVGGLESGMEMAKDAADESSDVNVTVLKYLKEKRENLEDDIEEELMHIVEKNLDFYHNVEDKLESRVDRANERLRYNELYFETHMVVEDGTDLAKISDDKNPIHVSDLDHMDNFDNYDLDLPTPLLCAYSDRKSTSIYPLIPVNDVLICTCGDKQRTPDSPLCFHEIAALLQMNRDELDPEGPETWIQLASPKAYS